MKRTRAAIVAVAGAALGVLTLRALRNRGSSTDEGQAESADGPDDSDTLSESSSGQQTEPTSAAERTPRIRPAEPKREPPADAVDRRPRLRRDGVGRTLIPDEVDRRPRIRPREPALQPRLRKAGKGWIRR